MALLLIQSPTPGLLTVNGQFCGRVDDSPHSYVTRATDRGYLSFLPLTDGFLPLAREIELHDQQLLPPADGLYALQWPDGVCQLELRPIPLPSADTVPLIPADAKDISHRTLPDGLLLHSFRSDDSTHLYLCSEAGRPLDSLRAERITWETTDILQAFEAAHDVVGHASLCTYRVTRDKFHLLSRQNVWADGAPHWPVTPLQTLRAYLEALRIGADAEAVHYLTAPDRHSALGGFDRVVDLRFPLQHPDEQLPLTLGILTVVSATLARVRAVCARSCAVSHAQGAHKLEEIRLLS